MFGPRWEPAVPVFAILTLMAPVTALYGVINPLLTAAGRTKLVSQFAWVNALSIMLAAWFAAPYGLSALAWALAGRGVLGVALFVAALKLGVERPVRPILRLLVLPCVALVAARLAAYGALQALPAAGELVQLLVAAAVASAVFGLVVLLAAPRRMTRMAARLHRALLGAPLA
jgi:O-antigen/teichoic acid export membrane protein